MTAITPDTRDRLVKLLGLLGSDHAGERDAAGQAAMRLLRANGLTWCDVFNATPTPPPQRPSPPPRRRGWQETVRRCRAMPGSLRPWETGFLAGLDRFPRLSRKQATILREIAERLGVQEGAR